MIIGVFGTNGSGKSTVVRQVMGLALSRFEVKNERGRVVGYEVATPGALAKTFVPGRYVDGVGTGGCDTVKDPIALYSELAEWHERTFHVLYEGIRMMNHMRSVELQKRTRALTVVLLTTSFTEAMARIRARQEQVGRVKPVVEKDILGNVKRSHNCAAKVRQVGAHVVECRSDEAAEKIVEMLRENAT